MSILSLFIFIVGVLTASSFVTSSSEEITLQDNLSSDLPGYYIWAKLISRELDRIPDGIALDGIDERVYKDQLEPAIRDFIIAVPTDQIEITAECFFSLLVNWLVANDRDLNSAHLKTDVIHQMYLRSSSITWGSPDLIIESTSQGSTQPVHATIVELKYFNRQWSTDWETQLCSYMLGYYDKTRIEAHGVISNMVRTKHYNCKINREDEECYCQVSQEFRLFDPTVGVPGYSNFNHDFFLSIYARYLKELHNESPPNFRRI